MLKNALTLDIPDEDGDFSATMVRDATLEFVEVCETWDEQGIDPVLALLVALDPQQDRRG